jgi:hypothetical protein
MKAVVKYAPGAGRVPVCEIGSSGTADCAVLPKPEE